ncbi:unnamed protein product [Moneuplotes crassus]|uniref:Uncharacterized protein n=1 Tax=Euplotes crassus TaxID=5936 RepID=A0AAD1Y1P9_EUPCR|nr:unnamed protein product [Moneuplotes crassus]
MADFLKPKKSVKKTKKLDLKRNLRGRKVSQALGPEKLNIKPHMLILEKFKNQFCVKNTKYIEKLWEREAIGDHQKLSTLDLQIPEAKILPELHDKLMSCDLPDNISKMKLLGKINAEGTPQIIFKDIIGSEAYKKQILKEPSRLEEDAYRFGFEDIEGMETSRRINRHNRMTRKELLEVCVDHAKKIPIILQNKDTEEEKRLFTESDLALQEETELIMFSKFFKIFPIIKRKDCGLDIRYTYLIPNIEFIFCPIKSLPFGSSKALGCLEGKASPEYSINFKDCRERSGFLSIDGKNKLIPYTTSEIKNKPISGLWIYNDTLKFEKKSKVSPNKLVQKTCLNWQVWSHCLRFIYSLKKIRNNIETASKSGTSLLLCIFFKHLAKPLLCEFRINEVSNTVKKRRNSTKLENQLRNLKNRWIVYTFDDNSFPGGYPTNRMNNITSSITFSAYCKYVLKHNARKRNFESMKRAVSCSYTHDNSENIHPNRLSTSSSYINQSHDAGRNNILGISYSYSNRENSTLQENDTSWYSCNRPPSSVSISQRKVSQTPSLNPPPKASSSQKEDLKINSNLYRPLSNAPIGFTSYKPCKPSSSMGNHKRCFNSLSTIIKDETIPQEDISTIHPLENSNAVSPMKGDEEGARISFMQSLQARICDLERLVEEKKSVINQQKQTIVNMKNSLNKQTQSKGVQVQDCDFGVSQNMTLNDYYISNSTQQREKGIKTEICNMKGPEYYEKETSKLKGDSSFHIIPSQEYDTPLCNMSKMDKLFGKTLKHFSIERNLKERSASHTKSEKNMASTSVKSNLSRKGIKIDMKKLNLKILPGNFLLNKEKSFNLSTKDLKSTGRTKKKGDYESDSELNSNRFNQSKSIGIQDSSYVSQFRMKMPVMDNDYQSKKLGDPSEPKSSSRHYKDWSRTIPEFGINSDSELDTEH